MLNSSWQTHILNLTHIKSPPGVRTSESNAFPRRKTVLAAHLGTPLCNTMEAHVVVHIGAVIHCCQVLHTINRKKARRISTNRGRIEGASETLTLEIWGNLLLTMEAGSTRGCWASLACPRSPEFATTAGGEGSPAGRQNQVAGAGTVHRKKTTRARSFQTKYGWPGWALLIGNVRRWKFHKMCHVSLTSGTRMSETLLIGQKSTISGHCKKLAGYL
jgi:hypothetical protein